MNTTKIIGILLIIIALALLIIVIPLSFRVAEIGMEKCVHEAKAPCSIISHIPLSSHIGFGLILTLAGFGAYLIFKAQKFEKFSRETLQKIKDAEKRLAGDEKATYQTIVENNGVLFQSELVEKSGLDKVKVTRLLDKLEAKGIIERRRRGMTNIVLLKGAK